VRVSACSSVLSLAGHSEEAEFRRAPPAGALLPNRD